MNMPSVKSLVLIVTALTVTVIASSLPAPAQSCKADPTEVDLGCSGCTTTIMLSCESLGEECEGCEWGFSASLTCFPVVQNWNATGELECGDKFEYRFGGCGTGGAVWGGVVCKCLDCP